jgi:outer membrane protein insertion porin family
MTARRARRLPALALLIALAAVRPPGAVAQEGRVVAVAFLPADRVGPYRFAELVAVRAGDPVTPDLLERNLRLLRATGLFENVAGGLTQVPGGAGVVFTVRPHPIVAAVRIRGNFFVLERDLASLLRLRQAEPFREELVRGDVERLRRHYEEQGYEATGVTGEISREGGQVRVTYRIVEGRPRVIGEVVLRGNKSLGEAEVLGVLGITRHSFFRDSDLQRGLDRLRDFYQRRGYLDVRATAQVAGTEGRLGFLAALANPLKGLLTLGPEGYRLVAVTVEIDEGRRYEAVFRGLSTFGEGDLRPLLTFQRTGFFDEEEVAAGRESILAFYQERGHYLAEVDAQADYETGRVVYEVRENRPVTVAEVQVRGFTHFTEDWVRTRLEVRASPGSPLKASGLERDRRRIESWYGEEGFTQAEVPAPEVWPEASAAGAVVVYTVREGPRTLVRYVSLSGASALPPARLLEIAGLRGGEPYRAAALQTAVDRVRSAYARAGYPRCVVTARPDFAEGRQFVDLRLTVDEGRPQRLGAVAVTGNRRTARRVILRELPLKPGSPLDPEALAKAKSDLYDLGLFREVRLTLPEPVAPEAPQDLVLAVRERPTGFVGFGLGYSSDERFRGFVEAGEQNLFGTGRGLRWKSKVSSIGYRHDLYYQEPWLLDFDLEGQTDFYLESREEEGYDVERRGLALGVNRELKRRLVLTLRYRYEFVDYANVVPELTQELGPLESFKIGSVSASFDYDRRDNPISPRRGSFHGGSVEFARPFLGGDASFTKYQLESSWYLPLWAGAEMAVALRGGFTQLLLAAGDLPLSERFFLGGDNTVRGYDYKEIGPKDDAGTPLGGNAFALGNLELRFNLLAKLRGVLFFDGGELWAEQAGLPSSGFKTAVGAGLRYETPVGPVRLDWGRKVQPEPGESTSRWHLTIGYPF